MIFFRSSSCRQYADPTNIVYHHSKVPVIQNAQVKKQPQPKLLCILDAPFPVSEGDEVTYESSEYGSLLLSEDRVAFVESVVKPSGQVLKVVGPIPTTPQLLVYQIENNLIFSAEPIKQIIEPSEFWWMGKGIYHLHTDRVWRHDNCLIGSGLLDTTFVNSIEEIYLYSDRVKNVQKALRIETERLGLILRSQFTNITQKQCESLAELGDLWHLAWCWSEQWISRRFQKPLKVYSFSWSYKEEI